MEQKGPSLYRSISGSTTYSYSRLEQMCHLDVDHPVSEARLTSIVATLGPACDSIDTLRNMIDGGVNIFRLNLAYRTHQYFADAIKKIRTADLQLTLPLQVAIGTDITGPGIRIGLLKEEVGLGQELKMKRGDKMRFSTDKKYYDCGNKNIVYVDAEEVLSHVQVGNKVTIEDGPLTLVVTATGPDFVDCEVDEPGELGGRMCWTVPGLLPREPKLSEKDKEDLKFAVKHDVDVVFASWVWTPDLIKQIRAELGPAANTIKIIAKIENAEGVRGYDEILNEADGIMIARGNLGVSIQPEKVFLAQKMMIGKANRAGKPVICATQMLASMIHNPRPTRAEVADVANAILDGADGVMLSRETARGKHPLLALGTVVAVSKEAEAAIFSDEIFHDLRILTSETEIPDSTHTTAIAAVEASHKCHAKAIVVVTSTGKSAEMIARYRPRCVIVAITRNPKTARCMQLHRGIFPVLHTESRNNLWVDDVDHRINQGLDIARDRGYLSVGDVVVLVTGWTAGAGYTNTVRIIACPDSKTTLPFLKISSSNNLFVVRSAEEM